MIGFCPQENLLWDELTVREHLKIFGLLRGFEDDLLTEQIYEISACLQLQGIIDRPVGQLSGGQKRKCQLGIAFLGRPHLVILDEPSRSLDPVRRRRMWDLTKSIDWCSERNG